MAVAAASQYSASIGPYRTMRQLGAGAMGEVFLAHDDELGREIAVKLLPPHLAESAEHLFRLRHEARSASSLNHPNIVTIYEIGRDEDGRAFMAMEYVDGQTLRELLMSGALPVKKALQLAVQIADGLAAAHKRGLVHRDLKPENIMITGDGVVKILDFGLAKSAELAGALSPGFTEPGMIVGTPAYMSPEQARGGEVDYRSDQFSLGAILYEMLTGRHAFQGESGVETLFMIVRDEPAPLSALAPHVPAPLRWIVDRCLAKDIEDRYAATRDLARDLQCLRDHFSEAGVVTPLRSETPALAQRARQLWPFAAMLVVALVIGGLSTLWIKKAGPRSITSEHYLTYSGQDFSPAVSPDGKLMAFSSNRDGKLRIWLKEVAGGSEVPLTAGRDDFPRFSPDGSSIIYIHGYDDPDAPPSLYRVPVVGGEARRVLENVIAADFSPDGRSLAFTRNNSPENGAQSVSVFVAAADGSNPRELATVDLNALVHPRWSPDGKRIAAVGASGRVVEAVYIFDAKSGAAKILSSPAKAGEISSVVWTRDSKSVIYVRADSVEAVVGSAAHVIRHDVDRDRAEEIAWTSHNGALLDVLAGGRLILDARSPSDNLRETSIAGGNVNRWITRGNSSDRQPVYAPDGKSILFTSNRSGNLDLWMVTADGGTVKRVTEDAAEDWDPAFTADGKKIVWSSGRSGNLEIWLANADGSEARQISHDGQDAENPTATADGWVIYDSFNTSPEKMGVWKVRQDGTQATRLVAGRTSLPEVSPDGRYVAYIADGRSSRQALRVVRLADGKDMGFAIPIRATHRTGAILGRVRWMPDGKAIAYLAQDESGVNGIFVQDFVAGVDTTKTRRPLGGFDRERATESFGISPDGKTLTIAGWEQLFSILSVEGVPEVARKES